MPRLNIITTEYFSKIIKILITALTFFLGKKTAQQLNASTNGRTWERISKYKRLKAHKMLQKQKKETAMFGISVTHLIHDPQGFAEKQLK